MKNTTLALLIITLVAVYPCYAEGLLTRNVSGAVYLDAEAFSRQNNLRYAWDPVVKNATIGGGPGKLIFHAGSEYALHQNAVVRLDSKTRFLDNRVWVPYIAKNYLQSLSAAPVQETIPTHRIRKVVVDPGHGGEDTGAMGSSGILEKELVLQIAKKLKQKLEAYGIEVILTRDRDVFISLKERAQMANDRRADFFVSIHANASPTKSLNGFETYTLSEETDDVTLAAKRAGGDKLNSILWDLKETQNRKESIGIAEHIVNSVEQSVETATRRLRGANFYVLKWTECPAVLVEIGYVTNHEDALRLRSPIYKERLADALVQGLLRYKEEFERTDGYTK